MRPSRGLIEEPLIVGIVVLDVDVAANNVESVEMSFISDVVVGAKVRSRALLLLINDANDEAAAVVVFVLPAVAEVGGGGGGVSLSELLSEVVESTL